MVTENEFADLIQHCASGSSLPQNLSSFQSGARATPPVPNPTLSYWLSPPPTLDSNTDPLAKEGSEGALTLDADICVIGSGMTGTSVVFHLSRAVEEGWRGREGRVLKVVLLDARDFCSGATGRNGGHLTPFLFREFIFNQSRWGTEEAVKRVLLEQHTVRSLVELVEERGWNKVEGDKKQRDGNGDWDGVDLVKGDHFDAFFDEEDEKEYRRGYEEAEKAGVDLDGVEWFGKDEMEEFGAHYPAVRVPAYTFWPQKMVTRLYGHSSNPRTNLNFEVKLHTNTTVTSISPNVPPPPPPSRGRSSFSPPPPPSNVQDSDRRWKVHTPRGTITCRTVVHATNGYASYLLPHLSGGSKGGIVPVRGQFIATSSFIPAKDFEKTIGESELETWSFGGTQAYWHPRFPKSLPSLVEEKDESSEEWDNRPAEVIIGGAGHVDGNSDDSKVDESGKTGVLLREFLPKFFPGQFEVGRDVDREWTGI